MKYSSSKQQFLDLLELPELDSKVQKNPLLVSKFEEGLKSAIASSYESSQEDPSAHQFLQEVLYKINRLSCFWYGDLKAYNNDDSLYLHKVLKLIESAWQKWELEQLKVLELQTLNAEDTIRERARVDVDPPLSEQDYYLRNEITIAGYQRLLAILSLDGLVEGSRIPYLLAGAANEIQSVLTRIFLEEYGSGHLNRKHSTFFVQMLNEFEMNIEPEGYFDLIPWEVLATINHGFFLIRRKRHFLRYIGGLTYFELAVPAIHQNYVEAGQRLGLSKAAMSYWEIHIREDERHGRWMLEDVALPLIKQYPQQAWELLLGYEQEKYMGDRAGNAMIREIQKADYSTKQPKPKRDLATAN